MSKDRNAAGDREKVELTLFDQQEGVDWLLAWIVSLAERGIEIGITLSVGGQLVSGTLIGGRKYFEGLAAAMRSSTFAGMGEGADDLKKSLSEGFSGWKDIYPESDDIPSDHVPQPAFIHLAGARMVLSDKPVNSTGFLWRAKLSSVDGFTIGTMTFPRS